MKANRICPRNRHWGELAGKCINSPTRGRSQKGAELIVYCFRRRHLWGSKLHAGFTFPMRFYLKWSTIWGPCQKIRVRPYYNGYMIGGVGFLGGAWKWFQRSYIIVMPCLWINRTLCTVLCVSGWMWHLLFPWVLPAWKPAQQIYPVISWSNASEMYNMPNKNRSACETRMPRASTKSKIGYF